MKALGRRSSSSSGTSCDHLASLYNQSEAGRFGVSFHQFIGILREVHQAYLSPNSEESKAAQLYESLRIKDLVLARACAQGNQPAWDFFLAHYREKLYRAALTIAKNDSIARELADSLCSDLFSMSANATGERISKLCSYMGRCSLERWLNTILTQRFIDQYRNARRLVSLDERTEIVQKLWADCFSEQPQVDSRLETAVREAIRTLNSEERFILVSYYFDGRNLAELARMLGVHESTVSRRIDKITKALRKRVTDELRNLGFSARAATESLQADVRDLSLDLRTQLLHGISPVRE